MTDGNWCGNKSDPKSCRWREFLGASTTTMGLCKTCFDRLPPTPKRKPIGGGQVPKGDNDE